MNTPPNLDRVIQRLEVRSARLRNAATRTTLLFQTWVVLNDEALLRRRVGASKADLAAYLLQTAALREVVSSISRMLDPVGVDNHRSNRISFLVVRHLLQVPGATERLVERAVDRLHRKGIPPAQDVERCIAAFHQILDRLDADPDHRVKCLRGYRDENLAHDLSVRNPSKLIYGFVPSLLGDIVEMTELVALSVEGRNYNPDKEHPSRSAVSLWRAVAREGQRDRGRSARTWRLMMREPTPERVPFKASRLTAPPDGDQVSRSHELDGEAPGD